MSSDDEIRDDDWQASFEANELRQLRQWMNTPPERRLEWNEEMLRFAQRARKKTKDE